MSRVQTVKERASLGADALMSFRWDERRKRWDVTLTGSAGHVLARVTAESSTPMDRVTAALLAAAVRDSLEGMLPVG